MAKEKNRFEIVTIPTQTESVIRDTEDKNEGTRNYGLMEAIVKLMNDVEELKKGLLG